MSIGETLARARRDAGLSIEEVSRRTHIGYSVIDGIEHDDYAACGPDSRARGSIAAIARALGVDSWPLVEAYNADPRPAGHLAGAQPSEPLGAKRASQVISADAEAPSPAAAGDDTLPIRTGPWSELAAPGWQATPAGAPGSAMAAPPAGIGPPAWIDPSDPSDRMAAWDGMALSDAMNPLDAMNPPDWPDVIAPADWITMPAEKRRLRTALAERRPSIWVVLGAALVVFAAVGGILLLAGTNGQAVRHAAAAGPSPGAGAGAIRHAGTPHPPSGQAAGPPRAVPPASPAGSTAPASTPPASTPAGSGPVQALVPASIAAYGPGGTGDGDSPQLAHQALAGRAQAPWHSAWYATARFGNLQHGTGLLLDMGRPATITFVQIALGSRFGADLALRIGNTPALAGLRPVAHANGAGGVVKLAIAPTRGRYVLVWFTRLPPDRAGTFQASVYDIRLRGYR